MKKITKKYISPKISYLQLDIEDILAVSTAEEHDIYETEVNDIL